MRGSQLDPEPVVPDEFFGRLNQALSRTLIVTGGLDFNTAERLVQAEFTDLVGFGTLFISNPDLPERFRNGWPLTPGDQATFYGGGAKGYTDYPAYEDEQLPRQVDQPLDIH